MSNTVPVQIAFTGIRPQKPPKLFLDFDLDLANTERSERWFVLPDDITPTTAEREYRVTFLDIYRLSGKGEVIVGHFAGEQGFYALQLAPDARLKLANFPFSYWDEVPEFVDIVVGVGRHLRVAGVEAESWFVIESVSELDATVNAEPLSDQATVQISTPIPKEGSADIQLIEANFYRLRAAVSL